MKKTIVILDTTCSDVHVFRFDTNEFDENDVSYFFEAINEEYDLDLDESNCQWMIRDEITIKYH